MAVCDDEIGFREEVRFAVYSYSNLHRLEIVVDEFECGENLLESKNEYEIIFLDYKMEGIDGLATARKLREKGVNSTIIFLTGFPKFVYESFEVSPFRFFKKPLDAKELTKALDDYFQELREHRPILLKVDDETICVKSKDILYLEANNKKCHVFFKDKKLHVARTMATVERLLPKNGFIKVHRAFIINFEHIHTYNNKKIILKNNKEAPISRNYLTGFKKAYSVYVKSKNV